MCSRFDIKIKSKDLEKIIGGEISPFFEIESQVFPSYKSFVLIQGEKENTYTAKEMIYGLSPSWLKTKKKFATYNARMEGIFDLPTWRDPIRFKRCLIPLTSFYESIHEKEYAGHVVKFLQSNNQPLIAAGIWDSWIDPETSKMSDGFSIITRSPLKLVEHAGHDRSPILLHDGYYSSWVNSSINDNENEIKKILLAQEDDIDFKIEIDRELKGHNKNQLKLF